MMGTYTHKVSTAVHARKLLASIGIDQPAPGLALAAARAVAACESRHLSAPARRMRRKRGPRAYLWWLAEGEPWKVLPDGECIADLMRSQLADVRMTSLELPTGESLEGIAAVLLSDHLRVVYLLRALELMGIDITDSCELMADDMARVRGGRKKKLAWRDPEREADFYHHVWSDDELGLARAEPDGAVA